MCFNAPYLSYLPSYYPSILNIHTRGKPLAADVNLSDLARLTPGFVGADLENLVNEAAILAARRGLSKTSQAEFQDAIERIVAGPERQGQIISDQEIHRILDVAYQRAKSILAGQRHKLETLAQTLLEVETVGRSQFEALMA